MLAAIQFGKHVGEITTVGEMNFVAVRADQEFSLSCFNLNSVVMQAFMLAFLEQRGEAPMDNVDETAREDLRNLASDLATIHVVGPRPA